VLSLPAGLNTTLGALLYGFTKLIVASFSEVILEPVVIVIVPLVSFPSIVAVAPWPAAACGVIVGVLPAVLMCPFMVRLVATRFCTVRVFVMVTLLTVRLVKLVVPLTFRLAILRSWLARAWMVAVVCRLWLYIVLFVVLAIVSFASLSIWVC